MANYCYEDGEHHFKPIHFLRFILPHILQQEKLMIPKTFVKKYGEGLPKTVFFKPPNGGEWKVNLVEHDGRIWFQKGWKEFADYHSLAVGHILVFRYEGTSSFHVTSFLEIDYPFKIEGETASNDQGNRFKMVKVESISNLSRPNLHNTSKKCEVEPKIAAKQITALDRANPSFLVVMHRSCLHSQANMMIPRMFAAKYGEGLSKTVIFKLPNGLEWKVNLVKHDGEIWFQRGWAEFAQHHSLAEGHILVFRYESSSSVQVLIFDVSALEIGYPFKRVEGKRTSNDQRNKHAFVEYLEDYRASQKRKDNSSLDFLQYKKKSRCVQVKLISNSSKETLHHSGKKTKGGPHKTAKQITALDKASSFKPCNPFFLVVMRPSYIHSQARVNLPSKFCKRHFDLDKKRDINLYVSNGRVWPVRYIIREMDRRPRVELSKGWKSFAEGNNLAVGDVCVFELIDKRKLNFQIHIFRVTDNSNCSTSIEKPMIASAKNNIVLDRARSVTRCNPSFHVLLYPSYINYCGLTLPSKFCKKHFDLDKKQGDINLLVPNGRVWLARYRVRDNYSAKVFELSSGWKEFSKDNNLKVGDVCTFELIDRTKLTFQVHIFQKSDNSNCPTSQESADGLPNHGFPIHTVIKGDAE